MLFFCFFTNKLQTGIGFVPCLVGLCLLLRIFASARSYLLADTLDCLGVATELLELVFWLKLLSNCLVSLVVLEKKWLPG